MPKTIETKIFIEPRDAFQVAGEEAYGPNWRPEWVDDLKASERKLILQYLRAALKTGQVAAHWSTMDFRSVGDLTPQAADREFFRLDMRKNCAFLHEINEPVFCRIHEGQLRSFMRRQGQRTVPTTQLAADKCEKWLVDEFSNPDYHPPKFEDLLRQAKECFPCLSNKAFKEARKRAVQITGRYDIAKPGRRSKSNQSAT